MVGLVSEILPIVNPIETSSGNRIPSQMLMNLPPLKQHILKSDNFAI